MMKASADSRHTVLIVGGGGREHALAWKIAQSPQVGKIILAPGNAGVAPGWERWNVEIAKPGDFEVLARRSREEGVRLAVIGPDDPLAAGIVDAFEAAGVPAFGPSAGAARIESSKAYAKEIMVAAGVPTARYFLASSKEEARKVLRSVPWHGSGWVVKADGLALGKGVAVCSTLEDALRASDQLIGISGKLVIEECLKGEEISWMAFCDGERCALLDPARDHKRLLDGDQGPNTGGMGAFSPVPGIPASFEKRVREEVFLPVLREMKKRGTPFCGLLYAGLIADFATERFWVLEFNSRFGDPEAQVLLPRIEGDLYPWLEGSARGDLGALPARVPFSGTSAVYVVAASEGYPTQPKKGRVITGTTSGEEGVFFAGVSGDPGSELLTSGGRVLGALGMGGTLEMARAQAYERLGKIRFEGMQFRSDIAASAEGGIAR